MSKLSNNQGRGYEYACLYELYNAISEVRAVEIIKNSSYNVAQFAYNELSENDKKTYQDYIQSLIKNIVLDIPPILFTTTTIPKIYIQEYDSSGFHNIVIEPSDEIKWIIGFNENLSNNYTAKYLKSISSGSDIIWSQPTIIPQLTKKQKEKVYSIFQKQ